jgi:hypothetical protein
MEMTTCHASALARPSSHNYLFGVSHTLAVRSSTQAEMNYVSDEEAGFQHFFGEAAYVIPRVEVT